MLAHEEEHHHPNTTKCPGLDPVVDTLTNYQHYSLIAFEIAITTLILFSNTVVILTIIKTKQYKERTMNLIVMLCIIDMLVAIVSQPCKLQYFYHDHDAEHDCSFYILIFFAVNYFPLFSFYAVFILIHNNHVKLKYLEDYAEKLDTLKLISHILYLAILALLQSVTLGIAVAINLHFVTSLITPFEFIGFVVAATLQFRSHQRLKAMKTREEIDRVPYVNVETHKMCTVYLVANAIAKSPVFFAELSIFITKETTNSRAVAVMLGYALSNCTSVSNPITFVIINKEACKTCKRFLQSYCCKRKRRVTPSR